MRWLLHGTLSDENRLLMSSPYVHTIDAPDVEYIDYVSLPTPGETWVDFPFLRLGVLQGLVLNFEVPSPSVGGELLLLRLYRQMNGQISVLPGGRLVVWDTHIRLDTLAPVQVRLVSDNALASMHLSGIAIGIGHEAPT